MIDDRMTTARVNITVINSYRYITIKNEIANQPELSKKSGMNPVSRVHEPIQLITSSVTALRAGATTSSIHHNHLQLRSDRRATYEISKALIYILDCFNGISNETSIVNGVSIKTSFNNMQYYISALKLYLKHHACLRYH